MKEFDYTFEDIDEITFNIDIATKEIYPPLENLEVIPTKEQQVFNHENSYGYDKVTVNGVTLQDKQVTPSKENQVIQSDSEYIGLNEVTVNAIPDNYIEPTGTLEITTNGEHDVKDYAKVLADVHEPTPYAPNVISFYGNTTSNLEYELANLDISNLTKMSYMFYGNNKLKSIDLSNWDNDNITSLNSMFNSCRIIESINLSNFKGINVTDTSYMFTGCFALKYIDLRSFDFSKVTNTLIMFQNVPTDCLIIVKDDTQKAWLTSRFSTLTNVKTVAEL